MKKLLVPTLTIMLLAIGCQPTVNDNNISNTNQNKQGERAWSDVDTSNWKSVDLPETIVGLSYPPEWTFNIKTDELVELNHLNEKITIFYKLDPSFKNGAPYPAKTETEIREEYINTLKHITSRTASIAYREIGTERLEIKINNEKEIHNVFFVGTLLVDVYTKSPESLTYSTVVGNVRYRGF